MENYLAALMGQNTNEAQNAQRAQRIAAVRATQQARAYGANPTLTGNPHGTYSYQPTRNNWWEQVPAAFSAQNAQNLARTFTAPTAVTPAVRPQVAAAQQNVEARKAALKKAEQGATTRKMAATKNKAA